MPDFVCGICEATVRKTEGQGVQITTICARCRRDLAREMPTRRGPLNATRRSYPIRQELDQAPASGRYSIFSDRL